MDHLSHVTVSVDLSGRPLCWLRKAFGGALCLEPTCNRVGRVEAMPGVKKKIRADRVRLGCPQCRDHLKRFLAQRRMDQHEFPFGETGSAQCQTEP